MHSEVHCPNEPRRTTVPGTGRMFNSVRAHGMYPLLVAIASSLFILVAAACDDDDDRPTDTPSATPTSTTTATPEPKEGEAPEGLYGHGKRTGVEEIDVILEAWETGDTGTLAALARLQQLECVTDVQGSAGPPECPPGVAAGTVVDVMAAAECEGYWVYEDRLVELFQSFVDGFDGKPYYLYAAWYDGGNESLPPGYRLQFARSVVDNDIFSPQVVLDDGGGIFMFMRGCSPAAVQVPAGVEFALEPKLGAPTGTGIPSVDNFLRVRAQGDVKALADLVTYTAVACKLPSEADYWVLCPAGQPSGTMVPSFPWWGCHGAFSNGGTTQQIAEFFATTDGNIRTVLRFIPSGSVDLFPAHANLAVILERDDGFAWAAILDDDGNFYGMVSGCPADASELAALHFSGASVVYTAS